MSLIKKTIISSLVLGTNLVFSGTMGSLCDTLNASTPCEAPKWEFGAKALYLQPSIGNANIHGLRTNASGMDEFINFNPHYAWGFALAGAYYFNTGNDLNLNWSHIEKSTARPIGANLTVENIALDQDSVSINPNWNAVNLEFGQRVNLGEQKSIRFHGGAEYAKITTNWSAEGVAIFLPSIIVYPAINRSFDGFGPRVGADLSYRWMNGLGIYTNAATALLAGTQSVTSVFTSFTHGRHASLNTVVPELEAKLGTQFIHALANGDVTFDLGWMWINYFNAVLSDKTDIIYGKPDVYTSNFALQGLFFGLKWAGNIT